MCLVPLGQDRSQLPSSGMCRITVEVVVRSAHLTWCRWYTGELNIPSSPPMCNRHLVNYASFKLGLQIGYNHDLLRDKLAFDFAFWISHLHSWCVVIMELMLGTLWFLGQQCEHTGQLFSSYFIGFNLIHGNISNIMWVWGCCLLKVYMTHSFFLPIQPVSYCWVSGFVPTGSILLTM